MPRPLRSTDGFRSRTWRGDLECPALYDQQSQSQSRADDYGPEPQFGCSGVAAFTLTVNGTNFVSGSIVRWNGADRVTTFVSLTQLTATISTSDILGSGNAKITVFNPAPGGGVSNISVFKLSKPKR